MNNEKQQKYKTLMKLIEHEKNPETRAILISQAAEVLREIGAIK